MAAEPGAGDAEGDFTALPEGSQSSLLVQRCGAVGPFALLLPLAASLGFVPDHAEGN